MTVELLPGQAGSFFNVTVFPVGDLNDPTTSNPPPRSFFGDLYHLTWDLRKEECLYVGGSQAGPFGEVSGLSDSVIEGRYTDYIVSSLFAADYRFARIQGTCSV